MNPLFYHILLGIIQGFSFLDAIIIGIAQTIAIAPGISRSGITISAGYSEE